MITKHCFHVAIWVAVTSVGMALTTKLPVAAEAPSIDGRLLPAEIGKAAKVELKVIGGIDRPRYPTSAYLALTQEGLYIAFDCTDDHPQKLVSSARENGAVFLDDSVQIFITSETEGSSTNYYHFAVNARGTKYSSALGGRGDVAEWTAASTTHQKGWSSEVLIPLKSIGASVDSRYWRANLARERPARAGEPQETTAWVNPGAMLHNYRRFGFIQLEGVADAYAALRKQQQPSVPAATGAAPAVRIAPAVQKAGAFPAPVVTLPVGSNSQTAPPSGDIQTSSPR